MTAILLPPAVVFEFLFDRKNGFGRAMKRAVNSSIDDKTLAKLMKGEASERSAKHFVEEMFAAFPHAPQIMNDFEGVIAELYPGDGYSFERGLVQSHLSWQSSIYSFAAMMERDKGTEARSNLAIVRHLHSIDQASVRATALLKRGEVAAASKVIEDSEVGVYLTSAHLQALRSANNQEAFSRASAPVRCLGLLFVAAALEHDLRPDFEESGLAYCLPISDAGQDSYPFARCMARLAEVSGLKNHEAAVSGLLVGKNVAHLESQRRRYSRWRNGGVPERTAFEEAVQRSFEVRGYPRQDPSGTELLYYGLRYLHALSKAPLKEHFGSKKAFFDLYPEIYLSMRK